MVGGSKDDTLFEAFFTSLLVDREINYCLSRQAVRLGLSLEELQVLWILSKSEDVLLTDLSIITTLPKDDLRLIIAPLVVDGFVMEIKESGSGKRVLQLTAEGRSVIRRMALWEGPGSICGEPNSEIIWNYVRASRRLVASLRGHLPEEEYGGEYGNIFGI